MEFFNSKAVAEKSMEVEFFFGVIEPVPGIGNCCNAAFATYNDAKEYCEYITANGRTAQLVCFLDVLKSNTQI